MSPLKWAHWYLAPRALVSGCSPGHGTRWLRSGRQTRGSVSVLCQITPTLSGNDPLLMAHTESHTNIHIRNILYCTLQSEVSACVETRWSAVQTTVLSKWGSWACRVLNRVDLIMRPTHCRFGPPGAGPVYGRWTATREQWTPSFSAVADLPLR